MICGGRPAANGGIGQAIDMVACDAGGGTGTGSAAATAAGAGGAIGMIPVVAAGGAVGTAP